MIGLIAIALVIATATVWRYTTRSEQSVPGALSALSAADFTDSVGVNIHTTYYDTGYARIDAWLARIRELGIRHARDGLAPAIPQQISSLRRVGAAGARLTLIVTPGDRPPAQSVALAIGPLKGVVDALEGPNEPDQKGASWQAMLWAFAPALRSSLAGRLPLVGPSFVSQTARARVANLHSNWDIENIHLYPAGAAPETNLSDTLTAVRSIRPGAEVVATETGYDNALRASAGQLPVPDQVSAAYLPRLLLGYFGEGVRRTFLYELLDEKPNPELSDPEQHFGLLRQDLSPKPAFFALKNLLRVVSVSPGPGYARPVGLVAPPRDVRTLLLDRPDGSRVLLLWREAAIWDAARRQEIPQADEQVRIQFGGRAHDVAVHRPSRSAATVGRPATAKAASVAVGADVTAVSFH